jgi:GT2 family glycosyltransferase
MVPASIVIPTRNRLDYLRVALASIAPQAAAVGAELVVVDDAGASQEARALAARFGARYEPHPRPLGLNVARNTGVERSNGELVVFVDDDVEVCDGWLDALLAGAATHTERDVFTGPIRPRLEGAPPHSCGRENPPITSLDLGPHDTPTRFAWGANMAIRRAALDRVGAFDVSLEHGGDEQEWQERAGGEALYVADAALEHRRSPRDSRLVALCRTGYARGCAARRFDGWRGGAPALTSELRTFAGCVGHVLRYRCPAGLTMVAHSAGRLRIALRAIGPPRARGGHSIAAHTDPPHATHDRAADATSQGVDFQSSVSASPSTARPPNPQRPADDFLSGESGTIGGLDALRRRALDVGADAFQVASGQRARLDRAARLQPPRRRVLALCVARPEYEGMVARIRAELARSRHTVEFHSRAPEDLGKFENLNLMLASHPADGHDWLLVLDDDILLPHGFLDQLLFLAERFQLDLAQPAHRLASHAAWRVTRRHAGSSVRETSFVEIGPVTAFRHDTFSTLLPFPSLRMGWGLDMHWGALAREAGWRCGVIDATPISHRATPAASGYSRAQALAEARRFLADRPHLSAGEAQQTLVIHRRW